ncbi:MAG TPA: acetylornithine deacetylase [Myxococcales bacterium]|jgi:acetylornithine deacetylase|nr:acetylornithine deacetylase [Myxococcales bacterium]
MTDVVSLLRQLVAIDSTSALSNGPMVAALTGHARALGFTVRRQEWTDERGIAKANLIAQRGQDPSGLALVGHTDCVPYDPAWAGALTGEEKDGKLFGRGAADTKAFIAASLVAASRSTRAMTLVFTADEEVGCLGAGRLVEEGLVRVKHAIVGEPTRMIPVLGHKGYCLAEILIGGVEGHSAYPETGASAILAAGRVLHEIEAAQEQLSREQDPRFSPPFTTFNVGLISGGKAKNIIAGECKLTVEWRPLPGQDVRRALELLEQACAKVAGGRISVTVKAARLDQGIAVPEQSEIVQFLARKTGNAPQTIPFGTELPYLAALGAQACVFGPGDIRVAHRTGEFVPLAELHEAVDILSSAIEQFT